MSKITKLQLSDQIVEVYTTSSKLRNFIWSKMDEFSMTFFTEVNALDKHLAHSHNGWIKPNAFDLTEVLSNAEVVTKLVNGHVFDALIGKQFETSDPPVAEVKLLLKMNQYSG